MAEELMLMGEPCSSCPYRADHPSGVWSKHDYEKLRGYAYRGDDQLPETSVFLCHHSRLGFTEPAACKGWATVERESIAVRLGMMNQTLNPDQVWADPATELYESGAEAAERGLTDIRDPGERAIRMIRQIWRKARRAGVSI